MGKGMTPKKGYNDKLYKQAYDEIDWSAHRKGKKDNGTREADDTSSIHKEITS